LYLGKPKTGVILALDVPDWDTALSIAKECAGVVDAMKFNYPLVLTAGLQIINAVKDLTGLPAIADFKVADAPVTNRRIAALARNAGADALMVHGFIGTEALRDIKSISGDAMGIIIVTELTHPGGASFTAPHAADFAKLCVELDCYGVQAPGTRPERVRSIRDIVGPQKMIVSCGVGKQGGSPEDVFRAGADFCIVGRSIYDSPNPRRAAIEMSASRARNRHPYRDGHLVASKHRSDRKLKQPQTGPQIGTHNRSRASACEE